MIVHVVCGQKGIIHAGPIAGYSTANAQARQYTDTNLRSETSAKSKLSHGKHHVHLIGTKTQGGIRAFVEQINSTFGIVVPLKGAVGQEQVSEKKGYQLI